MHLKINKFEKFAKSNGYKNGYALIKALGCRASAYTRLKEGGRINPDLVAEIYNRFGDEAMFEVINFKEEK